MELWTREIQTNAQGKIRLDQFVLDEDYNVPDSKDDVKRIIVSEGKVYIDDAKPVENYLKVQGKVEFQILYVNEGFEPSFSCLEGKIPFVEMIYTEDGGEKNLEVTSARVEMNTSMIHSRKLRMKVMVEMYLESEKQKIEDVLRDRFRLIPPAVAVFTQIMKHYKKDRVLVCRSGVREGCLFHYLEKNK